MRGRLCAPASRSRSEAAPSHIFGMPALRRAKRSQRRSCPMRGAASTPSVPQRRRPQRRGLILYAWERQQAHPLLDGTQRHRRALPRAVRPLLQERIQGGSVVYQGIIACLNRTKGHNDQISDCTLKLTVAQGRRAKDRESLTCKRIATLPALPQGGEPSPGKNRYRRQGGGRIQRFSTTQTSR